MTSYPNIPRSQIEIALFVEESALFQRFKSISLLESACKVLENATKL